MNTAVTDVSVGRHLLWAVRREVWENRSLYLGPLAVAVVILLGFAIALAGLPAQFRELSASGAGDARDVVQRPYVIAALLMMGIEMLVVIVYCLDALYGERRDRSILFWKSLPMSDLTAVVAKASIPIVLLPVLTFALTVATQAVMLFASTVVLAASGGGVATLWAHVSPAEMVSVNLSHMVGMHGLWMAPLYAWLLLASAWATRVPLLWAVLPPAAIVIVERVVFNSRYLADFAGTYLMMAAPSSPSPPAGGDSLTIAMLAAHPIGHLLMLPALWAALAASALMLLGAARLRRLRTAA